MITSVLDLRSKIYTTIWLGTKATYLHVYINSITKAAVTTAWKAVATVATLTTNQNFQKNIIIMLLIDCDV